MKVELTAFWTADLKDIRMVDLSAGMRDEYLVD